ncbi:TPA: hypothetical protein ACQVK5_003885, partial [Serratia marcescens]
MSKDSILDNKIPTLSSWCFGLPQGPCAQCYPRLACPLHVPLFMQLHEQLQTAPVLGRRGTATAFFCMQNHAPCACTLKKRGPPEKK